MISARREQEVQASLAWAELLGQLDWGAGARQTGLVVGA